WRCALPATAGTPRRSSRTPFGQWSGESTRSEVMRPSAPGSIASPQNCAYTKLRLRRARQQERSMDDGSVMIDGHAPEFQDWSARMEDPAVQFELRNVLSAALDSLSEDFRAIVVLRDVEGLSPQDVSQIIGVSVAAVKGRTHHARLALRHRLGEYLSD